MRPFAALLVVFAIGGLTSASAAAPATISRQNRHLRFSASVSPPIMVPGQRVTLTFDVFPKRGIHVYARGSKYRPIAITLQPHPSLKASETVYPPASRYYFKPLNETVDVYDMPFRLTIELAAVTATTGPSIRFAGALDYQACDDHACYLPESIPFEWTIRVQRLP